jgi:hypothetical protein
MEGIAGLVLWLVLCFCVVVYAGRKGRSQIGFFLLSLFLSPLVGFILVAVGPSNPEKMGMVQCPTCLEWIRSGALKCRFCGHDFLA